MKERKRKRKMVEMLKTVIIVIITGKWIRTLLLQVFAGELGQIKYSLTYYQTQVTAGQPNYSH